jgi:hypothetical protein
VIGEPLLLPAAMLHDAQEVGAGPHRHELERGFERRRRDLFDLDRHDVGLARELTRAVDVVEPGDDDPIDDGACRAVAVRVEHAHAISERPSSERRHAAQLAATEDPDGGRWKDRRHQRLPVRSVSARTSLVRAARQARSRSRTSGWRAPTIEAASSAAFAAPGSPMASVPTGNALRHLHDGEECVHTIQRGRGNRHAEHGQDRLGGDHPREVRRTAGRRDDHLDAARLGPRGVLEHPVGRAVRRHDAHLVRDVELGEQVRRVRHDAQIAAAAHDDADEGSRGHDWWNRFEVGAAVPCTPYQHVPRLAYRPHECRADAVRATSASKLARS